MLVCSSSGSCTKASGTCALLFVSVQCVRHPSRHCRCFRPELLKGFGSQLRSDCFSAGCPATDQNILALDYEFFQLLCKPGGQPSHAYLTGRANAGDARVTTNCQFPLVSMATTLSGPLSDTGGCLISQRFGSLRHPVDLCKNLE
jgi:hypothetical protein